MDWEFLIRKKSEQLALIPTGNNRSEEIKN